MMPRETNLLERIVTSKRDEIHESAKVCPVHTSYEPGGLVLATLRRLPGQSMRLIAEIKPRSPSAGQLSTAMTVEERALTYARAGASMISVLVDGPFFGGAYSNLAMCRESLDAAYGASRPRLLCKEFVIDAVQIDWAAQAGADAVLLIAKIVTADELRNLVVHAHARGLEALVEVTTHDELQMAERAGAKLIGVNARDLNTLAMDHARAASVLAHIDPQNVRVHLSGLVLPDDVARIAQSNADAALVGEALMRQDDPTELLERMVECAGRKS